MRDSIGYGIIEKEKLFASEQITIFSHFGESRWFEKKWWGTMSFAVRMY